MDIELQDNFMNIMTETCRNQMTEVKAINAADAGEKMRVCYSKFYRLVQNQNSYYSNLTEKQLNDIMKD